MDKDTIVAALIFVGFSVFGIAALVALVTAPILIVMWGVKTFFL